MPSLKINRGPNGIVEHSVPLSTDRSEAAPSGGPVLCVYNDGQTYYAYKGSVKAGSAASVNYDGGTVYLATCRPLESISVIPVEIYTAVDLVSWLSYMQESGDYSVSAILMDDIDMTGIAWSPVGTAGVSYSGTFDGNGHAIRNLNVAADATYCGFFGQFSGTVKSLTLEGVKVSSSARYIGAIAGTNSGTITDCVLDGTVCVSSSISYALNVGGVVGVNRGTLSNCSFNGEIQASSTINSLSVGGIIGTNKYAVVDCSFNGEIQAATSASGGLNVGGILGYSENDESTSARISGCVASAVISAESSDSTAGTRVGGIVGYSCTTLQGCEASGTLSAYGGYTFIGGIAGRLVYSSDDEEVVVDDSKPSISGCWTSASVSASTPTGSRARVGGLVGNISGGVTVAGCYATGGVSGNPAGGVSGYTGTSSLVACYSSGDVSGSVAYGVVGTVASGATVSVSECYYGGSASSNGYGTKVDGSSVTWAGAMEAMNAALESAGSSWRYEENTGSDRDTRPLLLVSA